MDGAQAYETGYPYALKAHFQSSDPELDEIWKICWHPLEVDSHETFMDSAYGSSCNMSAMRGWRRRSLTPDPKAVTPAAARS